MEKTIKLAGRDYKLKASLGTIIKYREVFGSELFGDVKLLDGLKDKSEEEVSKIIDVIFRITYILHRRKVIFPEIGIKSGGRPAEIV